MHESALGEWKPGQKNISTGCRELEEELDTGRTQRMAFRKSLPGKSSIFLKKHTKLE